MMNETMVNEKKAKPDIERWYGFMWKGFCGECGRIMWCDAAVKDSSSLRKLVTKCRWCGTPVDWEGIE